MPAWDRTLKRTNRYFLGRLIATLEYNESQVLTATKTLITHRLGSVDTSSGLVERSDYFPFGEERTPSPQNRP